MKLRYFTCLKLKVLYKIKFYYKEKDVENEEV